MEDQTKKLHKDMKKSTEADLAMSKAAVKISGDLLSNPLCEQDQAFLDSMTALDTAMKRMDSFNQEKVFRILHSSLEHNSSFPFKLTVDSDGTDSKHCCSCKNRHKSIHPLLFSVLRRDVLPRGAQVNQIQKTVIDPLKNLELIFVHSAGSESDIMVFMPPHPNPSAPMLFWPVHHTLTCHMGSGGPLAPGPLVLSQMSKAVYVLVCHRYSGVFPSLNMAVKRREQALQDYKRLQSKVEKYEEKEKTGPVMVKLHQAREELRPVREDFDVKNKQLLDEMPKFYHSRIDYFQPSFEALIRAQVVYFTEMYTIFSDLTDQIDQAGLTDEQRERETEAKLSELRALSIVADD
ncbi:hypothetical protein F7725_012515 [Dissostichus mawsoni]|uniref:BAR domain-containing protein n=1 Tax=Dissostichus mawsoni TaxID=36200 RepID=A0A7J5YNN8_DISMA|nr:hypothetical protein F7725_012515 [Dissostichus mawsoni]